MSDKVQNKSNAAFVIFGKKYIQCFRPFQWKGILPKETQTYTLVYRSKWQKINKIMN